MAQDWLQTSRNKCIILQVSCNFLLADEPSGLNSDNDSHFAMSIAAKSINVINQQENKLAFDLVNLFL